LKTDLQIHKTNQKPNLGFTQAYNTIPTDFDPVPNSLENLAEFSVLLTRKN